MNSPLNIDDASYEKSNRKMRSEYTSKTGKKLGKRLTTGKINVEFLLLVDLLVWQVQ